ncbi:MAG TPA: hypothetical protein VIS76_13625 [Pseudomonadales bacterium]
MLAMVLVAGAATAAQRPYPVYTEYHLDRTMTVVGRNFAGGTASLADGDVVTAKQRFARTREQIAVSITFWRHHEKDDAILMLRSVIDKLDELDAALSATPVEAVAVTVLADQTRAACETCHAVYRDKDPTTEGYRLKPGSV